MKLLVITIVLFASTPARGEDAAALEVRGSQLAKDGHFSEAIDAFKQADRLVPRASHACLIALAYTRRELWPEAEIFFDLCHQRATPADVLPDWLPLAERTLAEHLATANVAPIEIHVEPANVAVKLSVSSFGHDEVFAPRTIHLAFGDHEITAVAPGYDTVRKPISIVDKKLQRITITLHRPVGRHVVEKRRAAWYVIGAGGVIGLAGAAYQLFVFKPIRDRLAADDDPTNPRPADYDANSRTFDRRRFVTLGIYAAGAATILVGVALRVTVLGDREIYIAPTNEGAVVGLTGRLP